MRTVVKRETGLADLIASSGMISGLIGRPESAKPSTSKNTAATAAQNRGGFGSRQSAAACQRCGPAAARQRPSSAPVRPATLGAPPVRSADNVDAARPASLSRGHLPQPQKRYSRRGETLSRIPQTFSRRGQEHKKK